MVVLERSFHGRTISIETGRVAKQAGGAVIVRSGDSMVLVTACMGDEKNGDFLPLTHRRRIDVLLADHLFHVAGIVAVLLGRTGDSRVGTRRRLAAA